MSNFIKSWYDFDWKIVSGNSAKITPDIVDILDKEKKYFFNECDQKLIQFNNWRIRSKGLFHIAKKEENFPFGTDITYYPFRNGLICSDRIGIKKNIFVSSFGDIFDKNIPEEILFNILINMSSCYYNTFFIITYNLDAIKIYYERINSSKNLFIGIKIDTNDNDYIDFLNKFLSIKLINNNRKFVIVLCNDFIRENIFGDIPRIIIDTSINVKRINYEAIDKLVKICKQNNIKIFTTKDTEFIPQEISFHEFKPNLNIKLKSTNDIRNELQKTYDALNNRTIEELKNTFIPDSVLFTNKNKKPDTIDESDL